jgi:hypothetical protein
MTREEEEDALHDPRKRARELEPDVSSEGVRRAADEGADLADVLSRSSVSVRSYHRKAPGRLEHMVG